MKYIAFLFIQIQTLAFAVNGDLRAAQGSAVQDPAADPVGKTFAAVSRILDTLKLTNRSLGASCATTGAPKTESPVSPAQPAARTFAASQSGPARAPRPAMAAPAAQMASLNIPSQGGPAATTAATAFPPGQLEAELKCAMGAGADQTRVQEMAKGYERAWSELAARGLELPNAMDRRHFWAQIRHESGAFKFLEEQGNGSAAVKDCPGDGIRRKGRGPIQVTHCDNYIELADFMNNFDSGAKAAELFHRSGGHNNGEASGPRGGDKYKIMADPDSAFGEKAPDKFLAAMSSIWWWEKTKAKMQTFKEALAQADEGVETVSRTVNGGTNGLEERKKFFAEIGSCVK